MKSTAVLLICIAIINFVYAQDVKPPIMGWSSWNHFRIHIDEHMIRQQADAMVTSGLKKVGYQFINIDDGYFGGRDSLGNLLVDKNKFPTGMQSLAAYIHSKGLKAGIYTDAGNNTCGSIWDKDKNGIGVGIYNHIEGDVKLFFTDWKFDFLKVDWCGGQKMKLDEQTEYTKIINAVKAINSSIVFNICRWKFPGVWAIKKADSWRISGDISENFASILKIIDLNAQLYSYASPGHYNDMDMLQVGRGMTYEEDKAHFSMWCMLNSPLLAGNDLRTMSDSTLEILSNKEVIEINQDISDIQARRMWQLDGVEIWSKSIRNGTYKVITILNRNNLEKGFVLKPSLVELNNKAKLRDLWAHKNIGKIGTGLQCTLPPHGVIVIRAKT